MNTVYFQPKGIRPQYCEVGFISENEPKYIWYLEEPCKILISEVTIIPKEKVIYNKKQGLYIVSDSAFNVGDEVWYKNKLRRIIDIKGKALLLTIH